MMRTTLQTIFLAIIVCLAIGYGSQGALAIDGSGGSVLAREKQGTDSLSSEDEDLLNELDMELGSDEDLLNELDMELGEVPKPKKAKKTGISAFFEELASGFEGRFVPRAMFQLEEFEAKEEEDRDQKRLLVDYRLEGKSKVVRGNYIFNIAGWAEGGNQQGTYAGATQFMRDIDRRRRHFELNEINVIRSWENFDITVGKKILTMGLSTLYSPTDRISPRDLNDPLNPKTYGVWLCSLDYYYKETTITLAGIPYFSPNRVPDRSSRWTGKTGNYYFRDTADADVEIIDAEIRDDYPPGKYVQGLLKGKTVYRGWDLFFAIFHGYSPLPVLKEESSNGKPVYQKEHPKVLTFNAGFSTTYKKYEFHGEGIFQYSYEGKDDNYLDYALGGMYKFYDLAHKIGHERIDLILEYGGEYLASEQDAPDYKRSSEDSRAVRNNGIGRVNFKYNEDLKWHYAIIYEFPEEGWSQEIAVEYKIRDDLVIKLGAELFDGRENTYFERWEDNDRLICQFEYSF